MPGDLPGGWGPGKRGAFDGDPISICLLLFMLFVLFNWMTQAGGPLVGCGACQTNVAKFFSSGNSSTSWILYLVVPLSMMMFANKLVEAISDEDEGRAGELARALRDIVPKQGVLEGFRSVQFKGTRAEFRQAAAQDVQRREQRQQIMIEKKQLEIDRATILQRIADPATSQADRVALQREVDLLDDALGRMAQKKLSRKDLREFNLRRGISSEQIELDRRIAERQKRIIAAAVQLPVQQPVASPIGTTKVVAPRDRYLLLNPTSVGNLRRGGMTDQEIADRYATSVGVVQARAKSKRKPRVKLAVAVQGRP